jgi:hypothetical protein
VVVLRLEVGLEVVEVGLELVLNATLAIPQNESVAAVAHEIQNVARLDREVATGL